MIARTFADHDFNEAVLKQLERDGFTVVRARTVRLQNRPDPEVLEWAASQGLPLLSHDAGTMSAFAYRRVAFGLPMPGLILVRQGLATGRMLADVRKILQDNNLTDLEATIMFVSLPPSVP